MSSLEIWCWIHFPRTPARAISRRAGPSSPVGRPGPREHAALCNDLGDSEVRKHEDETPAKTRHPDDCEVTQTGSFRGCNGARQLPLTPFGSPSSHKASGIVRLEGDQTPSRQLFGSSRFGRVRRTRRAPRAFGAVKRVGIVLGPRPPRLRVGPVAVDEHFPLEGGEAPSEGGRDITARANRARRTTSAFDRFREPDDQTAAARREGPS